MNLSDFLADAIPQFVTWLQTLMTPVVLREFAALAVVLLVLAPLGRRLLRILLQRIEAALENNAFIQEYAPGLLKVPGFLLPARQSLAVWLIGLAVLAGFESAGWEADLLNWFVPILGFWFAFRLLVGWLTQRYSAERVIAVRRRVLRPTFWLLVLLHTAGMLSPILSTGFSIGDNRVTVGRLILGLVLLVLFSWLSRTAVGLLGEKVFPNAGLQQSLTQVLATFVGYIIIIVGVLAALSATGIPLTALSIIAGGLVVGFGFGTQEVVNNFISGFILLFEGSIGPGDVVEVDGKMGTIAAVGIRSMRIKSLDNIEIIVPNSHFLTQTVTNYARAHGDSSTRVHVSVGVSYDANPREVREALLMAAQHPDVVEDPTPSVQFVDFGDNSLDFDLMVWTRDPVSIARLRSDLRFQIWDELAKRNVEIPFPQRDIHIRSAVAWQPQVIGHAPVSVQE